MSLIVLDQSITQQISQTLSDNTKRSYQESLDQFFSYLRENPTSSPLDAVLDWKEYLSDRYAPTTVNNRLSAVRKWFSHAAMRGLISYDMATAIQQVGSVKIRGKKLANWLTVEQSNLLLKQPPNTITGLRDKAILALMVGVALRVSEVRQITWKGVLEKLEQDQWILKDLVRKGERIQTLALPEWVVKILKEYALASKGWEKSPYMFFSYSNNKSEQLSSKAIWTIVNKYGKQIGVGDLAPHDLRRTWAFAAYKGGADLIEIQQHLGHEKITTTQIYLRDLEILENKAIYKTGIGV